MSFVSQIMRKASIVERSDASPKEKAEKLQQLVEEADTIRDRMENSFKRLSPNEMETLGPGRQKEIAQLQEIMAKLKSKAGSFITLRPRHEQGESSHFAP